MFLSVWIIGLFCVSVVWFAVVKHGPPLVATG